MQDICPISKQLCWQLIPLSTLFLRGPDHLSFKLKLDYSSVVSQDNFTMVKTRKLNVIISVLMRKLGVLLASVAACYLCSHVSSEELKIKSNLQNTCLPLIDYTSRCFKGMGKNLEPDMQMKIQILQFLRAC